LAAHLFDRLVRIGIDQEPVPALELRLEAAAELARTADEIADPRDERVDVGFAAVLVARIPAATRVCWSERIEDAITS